jgi:kynureninase
VREAIFDLRTMTLQMVQSHTGAPDVQFPSTDQYVIVILTAVYTSAAVPWRNPDVIRISSTSLYKKFVKLVISVQMYR